jgi:hypothetical protein
MLALEELELHDAPRESAYDTTRTGDGSRAE